jgi:exosortase E/protease (VPEID-CTERM system)
VVIIHDSVQADLRNLRLPFLRLGLLSVLLLFELIVLQVRFDTEALVGVHSWWSDLIGEVHFLPPLGLAFAAALLVFAGMDIPSRPVHASDPAWTSRGWLVYLVGHLALLALFAGCTAWVLEGDLPSNSRWPVGWVIGWAAAGLATFALWLAALVPPALWVPQVQRSYRALLAGLLVGVAAWLAGLMTSAGWQLLSHATLRAVHSLLSLLGVSTVYQPGDLVVGTPVFLVEIGEPCSGCEGIGLTAVLLGAYLWWYRGELRFPRVLLVFPLGMALIWLANVVRISALVCLGTWVSPSLALGGFHSAAGWILFTTVALGMVATVQQSRFFIKEQVAPGYTGSIPPTVAYLSPLFAILATTLLTRAFTESPDLLYPLRVLAAGGALWYHRAAYTGLRLSWSWQALALGGIAFAIWFMLERGLAGNSAGEIPWDTLPRFWIGPWLAFRLIGATVTVPLAEELAFRGYLIRRLQSRDFERVPIGRFRWLPFVVSSVLFGLLHEHWLAGLLYGMLFGLASYRRGELGDAVLAHAFTNALIAGAVFLAAWPLS